MGKFFNAITSTHPCTPMNIHTYQRDSISSAQPLFSAFRATVIEYKDIWYKDDGALTKVFCEDSKCN